MREVRRAVAIEALRLRREARGFDAWTRRYVATECRMALRDARLGVATGRGLSYCLWALRLAAQAITRAREK